MTLFHPRCDDALALKLTYHKNKCSAVELRCAYKTTVPSKAKQSKQSKPSKAKLSKAKPSLSNLFWCQNVFCCASVYFGSFNFFVLQHVFWFVVLVCLGSFNLFVFQHVFAVFCEHMSVQRVPGEGPESLLEKVGAD